MTARVWKTPGPAQVGQLAHRVIADLLLIDAAPHQLDWAQVLATVDERMRRDGYRDRAARQTITGAALAYLAVAPRPPWRFVGAEVSRPGVRFDLVWLHPGTGAVMIDEVKTGHGGVALPATRVQVERYLRALSTVGSRQSVRVRAISTRVPASSWELSTGEVHGSAHSRRGQRAPPPR